MKDVMLDLETLGTTNNAVVVQIGACYFDRKTGNIGDKYEVNVNIQSSLNQGFSVDGSTINWWLQQSEEARKSVFTGAEVNIDKAIVDLNNFLRRADFIWSHATFDFVIIMNHLNRLRIKPTFHYRSARDIRTLVDLSNTKFKTYERVGTQHNAIDDCIFQVRYCVDAINSIRKGIND